MSLILLGAAGLAAFAVAFARARREFNWAAHVSVRTFFCHARPLRSGAGLGCDVHDGLRAGWFRQPCGSGEESCETFVMLCGFSVRHQFKNHTTVMHTLRETIIGDQVESWMRMLLAAVGFVLLIACVNVASLLLTRATTRSREMGVRAALGASRWQLVRGVLIESLLLAGAGAMLGVIAAYWAVDVIRTALPANLPRAASIAVNGRVLAAAALAAVATGIACGIVPALQGSRPDLTRALRDGVEPVLQDVDDSASVPSWSPARSDWPWSCSWALDSSFQALCGWRRSTSGSTTGRC